MLIEEWQWDDGNLWKAETHGYTSRTVYEVATGSPQFRANLPDRATTHQMIGPAADGRFWTLCIVQVRDSLWRVVTGWPSTGPEREWYERHRG